MASPSLGQRQQVVDRSCTMIWLTPWLSLIEYKMSQKRAPTKLAALLLLYSIFFFLSFSNPIKEVSV